MWWRVLPGISIDQCLYPFQLNVKIIQIDYSSMGIGQQFMLVSRHSHHT